MVNDVCNGRGHLFFPNMEHRENIEYEEKLDIFFIPIFVTESYPLRRSRGTFDLFISPHYSRLFTAPRQQPVQHFNNLSKCQVLIKERKINQ